MASKIKATTAVSIDDLITAFDYLATCANTLNLLPLRVNAAKSTASIVKRPSATPKTERPSGPIGPVIPIARVAGPPEALVIGQQKCYEA